MTVIVPVNNKRSLAADVNWPLALFLMASTYSKLYMKLLAIILYLVYMLYKKYNFKQPGFVNLFYPVIILVGSISALVNNSFEIEEYKMAFGLSAATWLIAGVISYLSYVAVTNVTSSNLHATIKAYLGVNALVTLLQLAQMFVTSGHIPYWYWDATDYYGAATGDHLFGIFGNISIANASVSAMGVLYFIHHKEFRWALLCLFILMLCTSNVTLIFLLSLMGFIVIVTRYKTIRRHVILLLILAGVFYPLLTAENIMYLNTVYETSTQKAGRFSPEMTDSELDKGNSPFQDMGKAAKINYYRYMPKINSDVLSDDIKYLNVFGGLRTKEKTNHLLDFDELKKALKKWYGIDIAQAPVKNFHKPLKLYTYLQTLFFLSEDWINLFFGAGMGNFSSKTAIKATGLGLQGTYPTEYTYVSEQFMKYHFFTFLYILSLPASEHSIINMPNSVYNQIAGEYGIIGLLVFAFLYFGPFFKNWKKMNGGRYILALMLLMFGFEYWFEMISLTVIFELLLAKEIYASNNEGQ